MASGARALGGISATNKLNQEAPYRFPHPYIDDSMTFRAMALPSVVVKNLEGSKRSGFGNASGSLKIALMKLDDVECDTYSTTHHMFPTTVDPFGIR